MNSVPTTEIKWIDYGFGVRAVDDSLVTIFEIDGNGTPSEVARVSADPKALVAIIQAVAKCDEDMCNLVDSQ